jgi:hypothetical protein
LADSGSPGPAPYSESRSRLGERACNICAGDTFAPNITLVLSKVRSWSMN